MALKESLRSSHGLDDSIRDAMSKELTMLQVLFVQREVKKQVLSGTALSGYMVPQLMQLVYSQESRLVLFFHFRSFPRQNTLNSDSQTP
jgi:hypothetical protein